MLAPVDSSLIQTLLQNAPVQLHNSDVLRQHVMSRRIQPLAVMAWPAATRFHVFPPPFLIIWGIISYVIVS